MDKKIVCKGCNAEFVFTESEQTFYKEKGLNAPLSCKDCRAKRKQQQGAGGWQGDRRPNNGGRK